MSIFPPSSSIAIVGAQKEDTYENIAEQKKKRKRERKLFLQIKRIK